MTLGRLHHMKDRCLCEDSIRGGLPLLVRAPGGPAGCRGAAGLQSSMEQVAQELPCMACFYLR